MVPIHPGRILEEELGARNLPINRLAIALRVPSGRLTYIVHGKRSITPDTALRLARFNLQARYDLAVAEKELGRTIAAEVKRAVSG